MTMNLVFVLGLNVSAFNLLTPSPFIGELSKGAKIALSVVSGLLTLVLLLIIVFLLQLFRNANLMIIF